MLETRLIPFASINNFRDFGGYATRDSGWVAHGRLFRSAHLADASGDDCRALDGLGIGFVCDLRRPKERQAQPNRWPGDQQPATLTCVEGEEEEPPHRAFLRRGDTSPAGVRAFMQGVYRKMPSDPRYARLFSRYFAALQEVGEGGALVHCAAGKDRTGVLCALTLHILGVDRDIIQADYELTNIAVDLEDRLPRARDMIKEQLGKEMELEALRPFLGVDADYLQTAFDAMGELAGSVDGYLEQHLGVDSAARARLVGMFCVDAPPSPHPMTGV